MSSGKEVQFIRTNMESLLLLQKMLAESGKDYKGVVARLREETGIELHTLDVPKPHHAGIMGVEIDGGVYCGLAFVGADESNCQIAACFAQSAVEALALAANYVSSLFQTHIVASNNKAAASPRISASVMRFVSPESYFGRRDRCVPVVAKEYATEKDLRRYAVPVEEYIAEQLKHRIVGDLLVLEDNDGVQYHPEVGLVVSDKYDRPFKRDADSMPVYSYSEFTLWASGAQLASAPAGMSECRYVNEPVGGGDVEGLVEVDNKGEFIVGTSYFSTGRAKKGLVFLSINAGAFRLLLPRAVAKAAEDITTARHVVITYGVHQQFGRPMYELLFDDGSDCPFTLYIQPGQIDRGAINIAEAASQPRKLHVYLEDSGCRLVASFNVFFRQSKSLPCLEPWKGSE